MLRAVSISVSPLLTLLPFSEKSITSADSREAAREKLVRVRVLSSKKVLTTTRPRSAGYFLTLRIETSLNIPAVSSTMRISSAVNSSSVSRCFFVHFRAAFSLMRPPSGVRRQSGPRHPLP
jgi:hypothetical protein